MNLQDLPTPCLILNKPKLLGNLDAMAGRAAAHGVALRPHLKTAKSIDVARLAAGDTEPRITVSTLAEARYFVDNGVGDLTYAVGIAPGKLAGLCALRQSGSEIGLITDNGWAAQAVSDQAAALDLEFSLAIEIDCGGRRGGLTPDAPDLVALGQLIDSNPGTRLAGVLTHAGQSYMGRSITEITAIAETERAAAVAAAERLRAAGLPCPTVSVGSTPTARFAASLDGVTEIRPGVYVFMDLTQAALGVCEPDDVAVSVLSTVIGQRPDLGRILTDAGALAMSQDGSLPGFGRMADAPHLTVGAVYQEHGVLEPAAPEDFETLRIGSRVRILPNHACMTAAMYDTYHVVDDDGVVLDQWQRCHGW